MNLNLIIGLKIGFMVGTLWIQVNEPESDYFYETYRKPLIGYAQGFVDNAHSAEDIVQEAFARFAGKSVSETIDSPVAFLYRVVRNLALDYRRRFQFEQRLFSDKDIEAEKADSSRMNPARSAMSKEELSQLRAVLSELPERTRIAVEMHRWGGCKLREIAEHLGVSVSMAQVLVRDGVAHCYRRMQF
ncbi:MAG: sigma-70 family RNA polymerase sigma factor [Verrucomicrobiota bacterium]